MDKEKFFRLVAGVVAFVFFITNSVLAAPLASAVPFESSLRPSSEANTGALGLENSLKFSSAGETALSFEEQVRIAEKFLRDNRLEHSKLSIDNEKQTLSLDLYRTPITTIDTLKNLVNLEKLYFSYTPITTIDTLKNLVNLEVLDLSYTRITNLSALKNLVNLKELDLSHTNITNLSALRNLVNLKELHLSCTPITTIDTLKNLVNLEVLRLSHTRITTIDALKNLVNLEVLHLSHANITNLSALRNLVNLKELHLIDTSIIDKQIYELFQQHPNREKLIVVDSTAREIGWADVLPAYKQPKPTATDTSAKSSSAGRSIAGVVTADDTAKIENRLIYATLVDIGAMYLMFDKGKEATPQSIRRNVEDIISVNGLFISPVLLEKGKVLILTGPSPRQMAPEKAKDVPTIATVFEWEDYSEQALFSPVVKIEDEAKLREILAKANLPVFERYCWDDFIEQMLGRSTPDAAKDIWIKSSSAGKVVHVGDFAIKVEDMTVPALADNGLLHHTAQHHFPFGRLEELRRELRAIGYMPLSEEIIQNLLEGTGIEVTGCFRMPGHYEAYLVFLKAQLEGFMDVPLLIRLKGRHDLETYIASLTLGQLQQLKADLSYNEAAQEVLQRNITLLQQQPKASSAGKGSVPDIQGLRESMLSLRESVDAGMIEPSSVILSDNPQPRLFVKGDEMVYCPEEILKELHRAVRIARKFNIEMEVNICKEDGIAIGTDFPEEENIAVIISELPEGVQMNTTEYFTLAAACVGGLWNVCQHLYGQEGEKQTLNMAYYLPFQHLLQRLAAHMRQNLERISIYSDKRDERIILSPEDLLRLSSQDAKVEDVFGFIEDIKGVQTVACKWVGMHLTNNYDFKFEEGGTYNVTERACTISKDIISIHNHPKGYPSPPSYINDGRREWGDILSGGFFDGITSGLVLDTPDGEELFLLNEPDPSNKAAYIETFRKFWRRRQDIREDLRGVAMKSYSASKPSSAGNEALMELNRGLRNAENILLGKLIAETTQAPGEAELLNDNLLTESLQKLTELSKNLSRLRAGMAIIGDEADLIQARIDAQHSVIRAAEICAPAVRVESEGTIIVDPAVIPDIRQRQAIISMLKDDKLRGLLEYELSLKDKGGNITAKTEIVLITDINRQTLNRKKAILISNEQQLADVKLFKVGVKEDDMLLPMAELIAIARGLLSLNGQNFDRLYPSIRSLYLKFTQDDIKPEVEQALKDGKWSEFELIIKTLPSVEKLNQKEIERLQRQALAALIAA